MPPLPPPDTPDDDQRPAAPSNRALRAALSLTGYLVNILIWCPPIILTGLAKRLSSTPDRHRTFDRIMNTLATGWVAGNTVNQTLLPPTRWKVDWETGPLRKDGWYLILANHQSWVDIPSLQRIFFRRIPFIKFFLKQELIWIPLMGPTWLAMGFPFMKRYSRTVLKNNPRLVEKDMAATRRACDRFRTLPVAIMHFAEGTRFSAEKHAAQRSPYTRLMRTHPKGIALILNRMANRLDGILDVTLAYPHGVKRFWNFICGDIPEIRIHVRRVPVTPDLTGNYDEDRVYRRRFHQWLHRLWTEKDRRLADMHYP